MSDPTHAATCPGCGKPLASNVTGRSCPACLMAEGIALVAMTQVKPGSFVPPAMDDLALIFPDFELLECIGSGGMGAVYRAIQPALDREVAIKILPPETANDPEFLERFRREAATLARLDHPNIVRLFDFGQREGFTYFVMEFVDGPDLSERLKTGRLDIKEAYRMVVQLCDALQHSHERGVVHRDIKPANVLLAREGQVKVADFGIARMVHADADPALTRTRATLGTPRYMAPEQMTGVGGVDQRADIYALGVVLYEMLTGSSPIGHFEPPSDKVPNLNPRIDEVVLRALHHQPERRFASVSEIKTNLRLAIEQPAPTRQDRARQWSRRTLLAALGAAALGILVVLLGFVLFSRKRTDPDSTRGVVDTTRVPGKLVTLGSAGGGTFPFGETRGLSVAVSAARDEFGLVVFEDGRVGAWGNNRFGQCDVPERARDVMRVAVGQGERSAHALALLADGTLIGWGDNTFGQARPPRLGERVIAMAAGEFHSIALTGSRRVHAWGKESSKAASVPESLQHATKVAAGAVFNVALLSNGTVMAWGDIESDLLTPPREALGVVDIAAGAAHGLALMEDGRVVAWGRNEALQCEVPEGLPPIRSVHAGGDASAAVDREGRVHVWGRIPDGFDGKGVTLRELAMGSETWVGIVEE